MFFSSVSFDEGLWAVLFWNTRRMTAREQKIRTLKMSSLYFFMILLKKFGERFPVGRFQFAEYSKESEVSKEENDAGNDEAERTEGEESREKGDDT